MNEWLKVMLEELARKRADERDAQEEVARRKSADDSDDPAADPGRRDGADDSAPRR